MRLKNIRGFTILELLVVVAIIAILAAIAIPNFIGRMDQAKDSRELAEINAVGKAISTYYADNGVYPTLQGKDGTLLQPQPLTGSPHNVDFSSLVPNYLATLPHFSYWWVDYQGKVYHTENSVGTLSGNVFTATEGYTYQRYNSAGQAQGAPFSTGTQVLSAGDYIMGTDPEGRPIPKIDVLFKNAKEHPESGSAVAEAPVAVPVDAPMQSQLITNYTDAAPGILWYVKLTLPEGYIRNYTFTSMTAMPISGTFKVYKDSSNSLGALVAEKAFTHTSAQYYKLTGLDINILEAGTYWVGVTTNTSISPFMNNASGLPIMYSSYGYYTGNFMFYFKLNSTN